MTLFLENRSPTMTYILKKSIARFEKNDLHTHTHECTHTHFYTRQKKISAKGKIACHTFH